MKTIKFNSWEEAEAMFDKSKVYLTLMKVWSEVNTFYVKEPYTTTLNPLRFKDGEWKAFIPNETYNWEEGDEGITYTTDYTPLVKFAFEMNLRG